MIVNIIDKKTGEKLKCSTCGGENYYIFKLDMKNHNEYLCTQCPNTHRYTDPTKFSHVEAK